MEDSRQERREKALELRKRVLTENSITEVKGNSGGTNRVLAALARIFAELRIMNEILDKTT